jgi:hypothetical protein
MPALASPGERIHERRREQNRIDQTKLRGFPLSDPHSLRHIFLLETVFMALNPRFGNLPMEPKWIV